MAARNSVTGDEIKSRVLSAEGRDRYDDIFTKRTFNDWLLIEGVKLAAVKDEELIGYSEFKRRVDEIFKK